MVTHPGATSRFSGLRPLNAPIPIPIDTDAAGQPVAVTLRHQRVPVVHLQDRWRIDDEWWRERPVSRLYWRLALANGRPVTVFHDLLERTWWQQNY